MALPLALRPTATSTRSNILRFRRVGSLESRAQALRQRLELGHLGLQHNPLVALFDSLLQRPHQIAIGAGHQAVAQFDHRHRHAERIVDAGHLQADDAAADHQQPLAIERQFQRAGRIDDARIIRQARAGAPTRSRPR